MERSSGNLAHHRLALVMPALFSKKAWVGALKVECGEVERTFWVDHGQLVAVRSNVATEHLSQVLVALRVLDVERAAKAFEAAERGNVPFGRYLLERNFVDRPHLLEALEHKAREGLFDCYLWQAGTFEFTPAERPPKQQVSCDLSLGTLHRDALAREREWAAFREVFPNTGATFDVFSPLAVEWATDEDFELLRLAEAGASLSELVASGVEGPLFAARRLLRLHRRGALAPRPIRGMRVGEAPEAHQLLERAQVSFQQGDFNTATALSAEALSRAPLPEAQELHVDARLRLTLALADEVVDWEGRLEPEPLPKEIPATLTADDLYLYARLKGARSLGIALRSAPMGELAAYRSVHRLIECGLFTLRSRGEPRTLPFGMPAIV